MGHVALVQYPAVAKSCGGHPSSKELQPVATLEREAVYFAVGLELNGADRFASRPHRDVCDLFRALGSLELIKLGDSFGSEQQRRD